MAEQERKIKCTHCGYKDVAAVFKTDGKCPRGHDPKPKTCGRPLSPGADVELGQDKTAESVAGDAWPHEAVTGSRGTPIRESTVTGSKSEKKDG
jgi:hypothetical protein